MDWVEKKKPLDPAKQYARELQLDFAAFMWRRMLELDMTIEQLAAKAKLSHKTIDDLLHARNKGMFVVPGKIAAAFNIRITIVRSG